MNPNLEKLAKETKNPEVKPEIIVPGRCLALLIECCENLNNHNKSEIIDQEIDDAIKNRIIDALTIFVYGDSGDKYAYTNVFSKYQNGMPLNEQQHENAMAILYKEYDGSGDFDESRMQAWMETWHPYKPHVLAIADNCCQHKLCKFLGEIRPKIETGKLIEVGNNGLEILPTDWEYARAGNDEDKLQKCVEDYIVGLK
jgi:hypothetical protein